MKLYRVDDYQLKLIGKPKDFKECKGLALADFKDIGDNEGCYEYITNDCRILKVSTEPTCKQITKE